jgi:RNase H-fold protein (predicted Holliday junction resolvase)
MNSTGFDSGKKSIGMAMTAVPGKKRKGLRDKITAAGSLQNHLDSIR